MNYNLTPFSPRFKKGNRFAQTTVLPQTARPERPNRQDQTVPQWVQVAPRTKRALPNQERVQNKSPRKTFQHK